MSNQPWPSGLVASDLVASNSAASSSMASSFVASGLAGLVVPVDSFGVGGGWRHNFATAGLLVSGLVGGGFGSSGFCGIER